MLSLTFVTSLLLATATLNAAAHRPAVARHHAAVAKHQSAASPRKKAQTKHVAKSSKKRKKVVKKLVATSKHRSAKRQVASHQRRVKLTRHHATNAVARGTRRLAKHQAEAQPASRIYRVTATVYQAVPGQTDRSPFITADNSRIRPRYGSHTRWLALSPDLLKQGGGRFHYGDKVQVSRVSPQLDGVYTVHDTMNRRHRHRIDILTHRREKLSICAPGAQLRLANAPKAPRKSRAQATAAAHARPGRSFKATASHHPRRAGRPQAS
jgi:3D (Asp-Asp-Asp) domain-containing protein